MPAAFLLDAFVVLAVPVAAPVAVAAEVADEEAVVGRSSPSSNNRV